jgi:tetratricopeptide (TPR) repeat protein
MKKTFFLLMLTVTTASFMFMGFQCGSAEMTSAKLYLQRSEWDNAKTQLTNEIQKHPENAEAWFMLGRVNYEQKNYAEMLDAFNGSLKVSNQYKPDIDKFRLSVWASNLNKGVDSYNKGIQIKDKDSSATYFNEAIGFLKTSINMVPDSVSSYRVLALCYYGMKDKDNAIIYLKQTLQRQNDLQLGRMLGGIYYDRAMAAKEASDKDKMNENLNEAIKVYQNTLKLSPNDANLLAGLNDSYIIAGRTREAMDSYKAAIVADPNNKLVHYNYGVLLLRAKNFPEAAAQFEETIKLDEKFTDALYNVSATYMQWGAKMKDEAELAVKDDKNKQIERSYEEKFKKAKANLEKLLAINKDDKNAWETLGMACTILNLPKEAKTAYEKADTLRKSK